MNERDYRKLRGEFLTELLAEMVNRLPDGMEKTTGLVLMQTKEIADVCNAVGDVASHKASDFSDNEVSLVNEAHELFGRFLLEANSLLEKHGKGVGNDCR